MHSFLLNVCLIYIIQGHVTCITLYASPNYIHADTSISLTCNVNEFLGYGQNVTFFRNSDLLVSKVCSQWQRHRYYCHSKMTYIYRPDTTPTTDETFSCEINGRHGQERNCTTVRAAALQSVTLSPLTTELNVTQGKTPRSITCSAVCWPICTFRWIGPNHFNRNGPELTLKVIPKSGSGTYWCQAKNVIGTKNSTNITLTVQYGPDTIVVFPSELNGRYIRTEGDSIRNITCWADCHPVCNYTWTYPDKTTNVTSYFYKYALEKIHDGEYTCRAFNEIGSKEKTIRVVVNTLQSVTLSPLTTELNVTQGKTSRSITCSAVCWPICTFRWIGPNHFNRNGPELTLKVIPKSGSGTYWCQAKNVIGTKNSTNITITVQYGPDTIVVSPLEWYGRYIRTEGDSIKNITCWADCHPVCNYTWTYPDKTTNVTSYFYKYALEKIHDGEYTCRAFNEIGSKEKTIRVVVNYAPENIQLSPNITPIIVQENIFDSITCSANCRPQCEYKWTGQTRWSAWNNLLFRRNVKRSDSGYYRCEVRNGVGRKYSSYVRLTVHTRPTKVKNITVKSTGSTTASIAWIPDMTVVPAQHFILHYKTRTDMDFTSVLFKEPEHQQNIFLLHVKSLIPSTEYVFKISSENYLGQTESIEFRSVTSGQISPIRPDFIGGIALILIALLVIIITMVLVHRFRLLTQRLDTTIGCSCCIKDSTSKTTRPTEKRLYENTSLQMQNLGSSSEASGGIEEITQERGGATRGNVLSRPADEPLIEEHYEIIQIPTTASLGVDEITKESSETLRDNKLSRPSGRPLIGKQYENLKLTPTDRKQNNVSVHNVKSNTKINQRKDHVEKKALKPLIKSKPHMKT
ncbi:matrix-remodeling-associated protein 5-like isoform X2 [Mytilus edulis]|uniref:matrix-remodeling-associated protein 5-like isoform X2 n=1 Tax=Mytilus edulis TaxID=6550 RepID=UPI0039F11F04